jgi:glutamine synthetase
MAPQTPEELAAAIEADGIEFLFAMFVDLHGKPCAKLVPVSALDEMLNGGAGFAGYAAGPMGQTPADPDLIAVPDIGSYTPVPWRPGLAIVMCDPHVDGKPWPYAPRVILKNALAGLAARGMSLQVGAEPEYFLVRKTSAGGITVADELDDAGLPCYDAKGLTRSYEFLTTLSKTMNSLGWSNYANDHEDGNGQFEQNFKYADALTTADRVIIFRYMVHALAQQAGMLATFMPKPFKDRTGTGLHLHLSLWNEAGTTPLFHDDEDQRKLGLSELAYQFIGGVLEHAAGLTAVACPTVNSYKRVSAGAPLSGAAWAPGFVTYGGNNRTQMIRVPDSGRIEVRVVDGLANPYLAITGLLAAGLDGIDKSVDPGEPNKENLFEEDVAVVTGRGIGQLPATLSEAAAALAADGVLREAFGKVPGGEYVDYYATVKRAEFAEYHAEVSPWEVGRYLTA